MRNYKLDKLNKRSFNCAEFMQPAKYIATNYVVDGNGKFYDGPRLHQQTRYVAEYMRMGADLVRGKYWWSGFIIGAVTTVVLLSISSKDEEVEEKEEEA
jgi:hypothetical protein